MEYNGQFRGGRGERGFGYEGKKGKGSRGRGRGRGQGGGRRCRDRGNFNLLQQRHEEQGYTEGYVNSQHRYSPPPQQQHHYSNGNSYLMHGTTLESSRYLEHQYQLRHQKKLKQYQPFEIAQDQYQQPQFQQQDYTSDGRKGDTNGNSSLFHPPIDKYEFQPQPVCLQQYQQPPPPQYQQPPPPPLHQKYQNESSTYLANLPKPPMPITAQPAADYAEAAPPNENVSKTQHMSYRERSQPPPLLYQQLQQQPPLPLVPQHLRGDWNYLPQQSQQWQQRSHQQQQFDREHAHQGLHPKDQRQTQRNQHPRFQERRQNNKQQRTPPPSYICHNCNQSGHWKQYCPLFDKQKNSFQQRCYSEIGPDQQLCFDAGSDSHDPRRSCGPHNEFSPRFEAKNELRRQPPLPNGPAPPLPSNPQLSSIGSCAQPLPPQSSQQVWKCDPCVKSFVLASQYDAHVNTHVTCSDCDFSACKRVVAAHYETSHGQYSGQGLKEVDVEGQKFMVLVGNSAEDIAKWREERRTKWLAMSCQSKPPMVTVQVTGKRRLLMPSEEDLEDGEVEENEEAKVQIVVTNATTNIAASDSEVLHDDRSGIQEPPVKKQRKAMLCKWFLRGRCRFNDVICKYSHDRSTFGCRAMMHKGSCSKGMHCSFSHDTTVLLIQRERSQKASKERATEQQWLGEQKSLLRKLLAKDVVVEQQKMLQIVHYLVENAILRSTNGGVVVSSAKEPAVNIDVLERNEMSLHVCSKANEIIKSASEDASMKEAFDGVEFEQVSTEKSNAAVQVPTKIVVDENILPVLKASTCEEELPFSEEQGDIVDDGDTNAPSEEGVVKALSPSVSDVMSPAEVAVAEPLEDVELIKKIALDSGENAAKKGTTS